MTDKTARIDLDLGIPAGSETCDGCCVKPKLSLECPAFQALLVRTNQFYADLKTDSAQTLRCPACLAAELRLTATPPTEPGYYKARRKADRKWLVVQVDRFNDLDVLIAMGPGMSWWGYQLSDFDLWSTKLAMPGGDS